MTNRAEATGPRILVAGLGNVLLGDDGFGVEVARRLARHAGLPARVRVVEAGIAGISLVQDLMDGFDALILVDALERGSPPGTLHVMDATVADVTQLPPEVRHEALADMHMTTPSKALVLARALGALPPAVLLVGCQPRSCEPGLALSPPVARAVDECVARVLEEIARLGG